MAKTGVARGSRQEAPPRTLALKENLICGLASRAPAARSHAPQRGERRSASGIETAVAGNAMAYGFPTPGSSQAARRLWRRHFQGATARSRARSLSPCIIPPWHEAVGPLSPASAHDSLPDIYYKDGRNANVVIFAPHQNGRRALRAAPEGTERTQRSMFAPAMAACPPASAVSSALSPLGDRLPVRTNTRSARRTPAQQLIAPPQPHDGGGIGRGCEIATRGPVTPTGSRHTRRRAARFVCARRDSPVHRGAADEPAAVRRSCWPHSDPCR